MNSSFDEHPVSSEWGASVEKTLLLDSKEKALYGGSIFIKLTMNQFGKKAIGFSPLFIHEVKLRNEDDVFFISITQTFVNPKFVEGINSIDNTLNINFDDFVTKNPGNPLGFDNVVKLKKTLGETLVNWNIDDLVNLQDDRFKNIAYTKQAKKAQIDQKQLYACLILGIFNKPIGSRGVISELTQISQQKAQPKLISKYFRPSENRPKDLIRRPIHVPTSLSEAQKEVFYAMDAHDISLVVGPPGTGKSHTIASLVIDSINKNKSVLVASKNNQAGKVIGNKIEMDFGVTNILIKTARETYKRSLISRLNKITYGITKRLNSGELKGMELKIKTLQSEIDELKRMLVENEEREIKWGEFYYQNENSFFTRLKSKWIEYQKRNTKEIWKINEEITKKENLKIRTLKRYVRHKYEENLKSKIAFRRMEFINLITALKSKSANVLEENFASIDFNLILKALPAWICNTKDISRILPLQRELFDIAIIDEASQCDIATMIPILYRAKKIVVVGDPKQLRHYSFLSDYQQEEYKLKYKVASEIPNYRRESLIDLTHKTIQSQNQVTYLDEHYRSKPDLISFSNATFYSNELKIMRANPHSIGEKNIEISEVGGERNSKGVNVKEATALVKKLIMLIKAQKDLAINASSTFGVISPFTSQVNYIKSLVRSSVDAGAIKKHKLLVGTPYHFQGDERDIILLSFAIDKVSHPSVYNYLNKEDVFNVTITRARNRQYIFTSIDYQNLDRKHLLSRYLNGIIDDEQKDVLEDSFHDEFSNEIIVFLKDNGIDKVYKSICVSGVEVDIAVTHNSKTYCIDLIGYPGEFINQFTTENIQMLNRMNQQIFFIPYSSWVLEKEKTIKNLLQFLEILPKPK